MKWIIRCIVLFAGSFFFTFSVDAAGAISEDEQLIIEELSQQVRIQDKAFQLPATYLTQAENYLKQRELTKAQTTTVIQNIQKVKKKLGNLSIDLTSVHTIDDLLKQLPQKTVVEIQQLVSSTAETLGLVVLSWNQGYVELGTQNSDGTLSAVFSSEKPIKQTGTVPWTSFLAIVCLLMTATGAFIIGKKANLA
ncbi:hypothetical protein [Enterococcus ratti]|nr:hypothetical protein [Enterococcus ratti]